MSDGSRRRAAPAAPAGGGADELHGAVVADPVAVEHEELERRQAAARDRGGEARRRGVAQVVAGEHELVSLGRAGSTRATRAIPASPIGARPQHSCTSGSDGRRSRSSADGRLGPSDHRVAAPSSVCVGRLARTRGAPARSRTRGRGEILERAALDVERVGQARALRPVAGPHQPRQRRVRGERRHRVGERDVAGDLGAERRHELVGGAAERAEARGRRAPRARSAARGR